LSEQIRAYLSTISLQDILQRKNFRQVAERQDKQPSVPGLDVLIRGETRA